MRESRQNLRNAVMNQAVAWAQKLEQMERGRGYSAVAARDRLSRRLGVGAGTFRNLVWERVKSVDAALRDRIQSLLVQEIKHEISYWTLELEKARQGGDHPACQRIQEIEFHLGALRSIFQGAPSIERVEAPVEGLAREIGEDR